VTVVRCSTAGCHGDAETLMLLLPWAHQSMSRVGLLPSWRQRSAQHERFAERVSATVMSVIIISVVGHLVMRTVG
jgi:hypothetical protein